jgi:hypothetical protein
MLISALESCQLEGALVNHPNLVSAIALCRPWRSRNYKVLVDTRDLFSVGFGFAVHYLHLCPFY